MIYYVTLAVNAMFVAEVEANDTQGAIDAAVEQFYDADFGVASDIEGDVIIVEDENGTLVWEQ